MGYAYPLPVNEAIASVMLLGWMGYGLQTM